jgi:hypothetical protein
MFIQLNLKDNKIKRTDQAITSLTPALVSYHYLQLITRIKIIKENFVISYDINQFFE